MIVEKRMKKDGRARVYEILRRKKWGGVKAQPIIRGGLQGQKPTPFVGRGTLEVSAVHLLLKPVGSPSLVPQPT